MHSKSFIVTKLKYTCTIEYYRELGNILVGVSCLFHFSFFIVYYIVDIKDYNLDERKNHDSEHNPNALITPDRLI